MTSRLTDSSSPDYLLEEGMIINGKWKILNFIAKGGKGEVYLARQLNLDRQVALKIMSREFIKSLEGDEGEITAEIKRFHREVQIMARIQHPNIIKVYDFDQLELDGMAMDYIVMEYIPGPTLRHKMPEEGYGHDETQVNQWLEKYFFPILDGINAVHGNGVIHRDMKPENILIGDEPPKIMDFGIAGGAHLENVTQTHHMVGTITYMPEEQFLDLARTDVRVDVYALGKILYEMVEGKMKKGRDKPFNSVQLKDPETRFFKILDRIIQQATARDRNQRTHSVKVLHDSLKELVMDCGNIPRPRGQGRRLRKYLFGISGALFLLVALTGLLHYGPLDLEKFWGESHLESPVNMSGALPEFKFQNFQPTVIPGDGTPGDLPESLIASDNMTMIRLPGGKVTLPLGDPDTPIKKQEVSVNSFYMDKTKVTNHLYVQFLHELEGLEVKQDSVFWNKQLLLLLGEVLEGYEPITYRGGVFRVKPEDAAKPVVRVTPVGALAYANYYGRNLPMMAEWWIAVQGKAAQGTGILPAVEEITTGAGIRAVTGTTTNRAGIRGLKQNVHEWTVILTPDGDPQFYIHGLDNRESYLNRRPWEAFSNVGFRTVLKIDGEK